MHSSVKYFAVSYLVFFIAFVGLIPACQGKVSTALGSTWDIPDEEAEADAWVVGIIIGYSNLRGYTTYNWYNESTTKDNILDAAFGVGDTYAISWYIGHGHVDTWWHFWGWPWQWHTHTQYAITANDGSHVYDYEIYWETYCQNVRFVYLWSCEQGNEIGSVITYPCGEVRARGMPLAWLHTSDLSSDGYENPDGNGYTFIGFKGVAPFLTYDGLDGVTDAGECFAQCFYIAALFGMYSIRNALDFAASATFGDPTFEDCILYQGYYIGIWPFGYSGQMVVYGDGNLHIAEW